MKTGRSDKRSIDRMLAFADLLEARTREQEEQARRRLRELGVTVRFGFAPDAEERRAREIGGAE